MVIQLTLIKGHTLENNYDGYAPHHHWELFNMPASIYLSKINKQGLVYPGKEYSEFILSPWQVPWIRENVKRVGYDFLEPVEPAHKGLYAFGDYHDGIDGNTTLNAPGIFVQVVQSGYKNANGYRATAEIYEIELETVMETWQSRQGINALNALTGSIVNNPEQWKRTLGEFVPQWLFWSVVQRLKGGL